MDDNLVTKNHPLTSKGIVSLKNIFTQSYYTNNADMSFGYRPVALASFAIEHQFIGERAFTSHGVNLLIYIFTIWILYGVLKLHVASHHRLFAFLSLLLFAIHPLHSETVASIKNRDELLALFFGALSLKYAFSCKGNLAHLIWASVFLLVGLLSKKSVFPLIYIIPLGLFLIKNLPLKQTWIALFIIGLPASIIAADFDITQWLLITTSIILFAAILYLLANTYLIKKADHAYVYVVLSVGLLTFATYYQDLIYVVLSLVVSLITLYKNKEIGVPLIVLLSATAVFVFQDVSLVKYPAIAGVGLLFYCVINKRINWIYILSGTLSVILMLAMMNHIMSYVLFASIALLYLLYYRKPLYAYIYLFLYSLVLVFFFGNYHYAVFWFVATFIYISIYFTSHKKQLLVSFAIAIAVFSFTHSFFNLDANTKLWNYIGQQTTIKNSNFQRKQNLYVTNQAVAKKEGRMLHYVENTLVGSVNADEKLATGWLTLLEYGRLMLMPYKLSFYYGYAIITRIDFFSYHAWLAILLHLILVAIAITFYKKAPIVFWAASWYLLSIVLFANWLVPVAGMVAERLAYTASFGAAMFIASLVLIAKPNFSFKKIGFWEAGFLIICLLLTYRTFIRNQQWKNPIVLMQSDIDHLQESVMANSIYANHLMYESVSNNTLAAEDRLALQYKAVDAYNRANATHPYFFNNQYELAKVYIILEQFGMAKLVLEKALSIDSVNLFALESMAKVCFELGDVQQTEKYANRYLMKQPYNENVHEILIYIMLINRLYDNAYLYANRALKFYPSSSIIKQMKDDAIRLGNKSGAQ
jgi:hypothetical protein